MTLNNAAASTVVAGFGFRAAATVASLRSALQAAFAVSESAAGQPPRLTTLTALATAQDKANHPALIELANEMALPLLAVPLAQLAAQIPCSPTIPANLIDGSIAQSGPAANTRIPERYGARSVAESSALAAAGQGSRLLTPRAVSADQMATAAIAVFIAVPTSTSIANPLHTTPL